MRWPAIIIAGTAACASTAQASCNWPAGQLLEVSGDFHEGDLRGTFTRTIAPQSGRFTEAIDLGIVRRGSGFDGDLAWSRDVSGASHYLNSDFARRLAISEAWLSSHLGCPMPAASSAARRVGLDEATGLDRWRVTPTGGAPIELWYDLRNGRLDRAVLQYSENRLVHHYSDWREVAPGAAFPFVRRDEDPEDESESVYLARRVVAVAKGDFAPPPLPRDSRILGGQSTTVPFEDDGGRRVYVPVWLNGKGPFPFELDNGGHFILTEATADALGLTPQGAFTSTGASTEVRRSGYVTLATLRIGNAQVVEQTAKVLPLSHNERETGAPRAGILGLEFFERFVVGVNHRDKSVTLRLINDSAGTHPGRPPPILFDEDAPLVRGGYAGLSGNVMLDIGNAGPTIIEHDWAARHGLAERLAQGTSSASSKLSTGVVRIGPFVLSGEPVRYYGPAERGSENTRSVAAIAGEPLLSRFNAVYDYGRGTVWLDPLDKDGLLPLEKRR